MEYVYPAIFHANEDGSYTVTYPDLPGCITEGKSLGNALFMAQDVLKLWLGYLADKKQNIPQASSIDAIQAGTGEFINFIRVDVKDERAVKRTVSIPRWMDDEVIKAGLSLSRVLQDALTNKLGTTL
jgi:predicted RNase H-like HicB family nuclease